MLGLIFVNRSRLAVSLAHVAFAQPRSLVGCWRRIDFLAAVIYIPYLREVFRFAELDRQ